MSSLSTSSKNKAELKDRILQDNILQLPSEFLRKYAKSMLENPCRFMTVYLRPYCSYCGKVIVGGGVRCDEVNPETMESRRVRGLYFAGEVLDLDANTGGYNLQIAFSTGRLAGMLKK